MSRLKGTDIRERRARFAFEKVNSWGGTWKEKALVCAKKLPVAIRTQGLAQTLAVLMGGNGTHEKELANLIAVWLLDQAPRKTISDSDSETESRPSPQSLLNACVKADRTSYLAAQAEAIALMDLVKLYAQALHGEE